MTQLQYKAVLGQGQHQYDFLPIQLTPINHPVLIQPAARDTR